jgi:hypothetical protein
MLAGVKQSEKATQLSLGILPGAADGSGRHLAPAGGGIDPEAVSQLECARRSLADVPSPAHLFILLCFV